MELEVKKTDLASPKRVAQVNWDPATFAATVVEGNNSLKLVEGSSEAIKNGEKILLDVPVDIAGDKLMTPSSPDTYSSKKKEYPMCFYLKIGIYLQTLISLSMAFLF